jgi:CoA:oxalate CoA-transferase
MSGPLTGLRLLDLTSFLSGPSATQLLGDLGADVIKVEPPAGDTTRPVPPYFVGPDSAYFLANNRNKRSVVIDLKTAGGIEVARRLIAEVDVVVDNFRPGVLERLGLAPAAQLARHPALIWASISGFGQDGPDRERPAYDMIVQALSGVMSLTGEPGGSPVRLGIPAGDIVAGLYAVVGVLAAWAERARTGRGAWVDASMLDGQLAMLSYQAVYSTVGGVVPGPQGSGHDSIPTYRTFTGSDGRDVAVAANTEPMWRSLCDALSLHDLASDPRFSDLAGRLRNRDQLWALLEPAFASRTAAAWAERLERYGVPVAPIRTVPEALDAARSDGRQMIRRLEHPDGRNVEVLGSPVRFHGEEPTVWRYPPALGEHTTEVLTEILGLDTPQIAALTRSGAIGGPLGGPAVENNHDTAGEDVPGGAIRQRARHQEWAL